MEIESVKGRVPASQLGRTLTHEHLNMKYGLMYSTPPEHLKKIFDDKITLQNVGFVKQYPYSCRYNLELNGEEAEAAVLHDVRFFNQCGGKTILENSSIGLNRNIPFLVKVSEETNVNIIAGTGYYLSACQTSSDLSKSVEEMEQFMHKELTEGCYDCPSVKCGFIGEVASVWPITEFERRAIVASAHVQSSLKCAVSFHPHRDRQAPFEVMRIFLEAGGIASRTIMSHLDRTFMDTEDFLEFAKFGAYNQLDLFGTECSFYQLSPQIDMPSDAQRIQRVKQLIEDKRQDRILLSHDIHTKHRLINFGGHGYAHIMNNVLPKMLIKGISKEVIDQITIKNPATCLSGVC